MTLGEVRDIGKVVSAHQPHLYPWLPYLYKISISDEFVLADNFPFQRYGDQNKFRLSGPNGVYTLTFPLRFPDSSLYKNRLADLAGSKKKIVQCIENTYAKCKYVEDILHNVNTAFELSHDFVSLCTLSHLTELAFSKKMSRTSDMTIYTKGSDRVLDICRQTEADVFICGYKGGDYLNLDAFKEEGIKVVRLTFDFARYTQKWPSETLEGLSWLDFSASNSDMKGYCDKCARFTLLT